MKLEDFDYFLPDELIASYPTAMRTDSRLLILNKKNNALSDEKFANILDYFSPNDVLVLNDSKVMKARLFGNKETGGKIELLIERILGDKNFIAQVKVSKPLKEGAIVHVSKNTTFFDVQVLEKRDRFVTFLVLDKNAVVTDIIEQCGLIPLPPYMNRQQEGLDLNRYQTVYSENLGSVAAPTAGLHFDQALLNALAAKGVIIEKITLHVGSGTFLPIQSSIEGHVMHQEWFSLSEKTVQAIQRAKNNHQKIVACGTTVVRALETAALSGALLPHTGETQIFIKPGFQFKVVDGLITNFHLPKSTLLLLVGAFCGVKNLQKAYQHAIQQKYRFYSYGDAMLIV